MKLLLDQNLSRVLVRRLAVIVSKDSDFRQLPLLLGPPPRVVWLGVGNVSTGLIEALLRRVSDGWRSLRGSVEESLFVLVAAGSRRLRGRRGS